jgi:hypothetical protein
MASYRKWSPGFADICRDRVCLLQPAGNTVQDFLKGIDPDEYQPAYFDGVEKLAVAWPEISPEFCGGKGLVVWAGRMMRDPYELLAVPRSASADDIKKSFRRLAKKLHPDANRNHPEASALFAELCAAHTILAHQETRKAFDRGEIDAEGNPRRQGFPPSTWHVVTSLMVAMVMLVVTGQLIMRGSTLDDQLNSNSYSGASALHRSAADRERVGDAQTEEPNLKALSESRLVLQPSVFYAVDGTVPLGIRVSGEAVGLNLQISSLPAGTRISSGRALGGGWRIPATDLGNAMIHPPPGFSGTIDLAVDLRLADGTIVDRALFRLEWVGAPIVAPVQIESTSDIASLDRSADRSATTLVPTNQHETDQAALLHLDHERFAFLMGPGEQLISEGDALRTLLRSPAKAHDAGTALTLGASNDPIALAIPQKRGVAASAFFARDWHARESGSREGQQRLNFVALTPIEPMRGDIAPDNLRRKTIPSAGAKSKKHVARMQAPLPERPQDLQRSPDRYGSYVGARVGADPAPLTAAAPAFLQ